MKTNTNTNTIYATVIGILLTGATLNAFADPGEPHEKAYCSLKTLKGSYTYSIQGYRGGVPYASSGMFVFDGEGEVVIIYTSSIERTQLTVTGTYTVAGNCSGTMTLADKTVVNNFYLSPNGESFNFMRVSSNDVIGTEAKRVSRELILKQP